MVDRYEDDKLKMHRCLITVEAINYNDDGEPTIMVWIPGWNPYLTVKLPISSMTPDILEGIAADQRLLGYVNIDADDETTLIIENVHECLSSLDDDGLV